MPGALDSPDVNHQLGDPRSNLVKAFYNAGYDLGGGVEFYSFGSYAHRNASAYENYRGPSVLTAVTSTGATVVPFPNGFNPQEAIKNNLFDKRPPSMPNVVNRSAPFQPIPANGLNVLNFPLPFAPWGIDGRYYYARVAYSF